MVGQRLVSRNHYRAANTDHPVVASDSIDVESPTKGSSPVKNPFKRKRRRFDSGSTKLFVCIICLSAVIFFCGPSLFGIEIKTLDTNTTKSSQLNLRPGYLTDDGAEDESKSEDEEVTEALKAENKELPKNDKNGSSNNITLSPQINLRPAFLTDDGAEDESSDEETEALDEEEEGKDEALDEEEEGKDEEEEATKAVLMEMPENEHIPRTLIFTHYKNLLELVKDTTLIDKNAIANMDSYTPQQLEELTLAMNVRHSIEIHQQSSDEELKVLFWTDEDCIASLNRTKPALVPYFIAEREGMYKADICRGSALLENGGFYLDVDVGVRHDLWKDLKLHTEFVTAKVHQASNWVGKGFFQAILGSAPQSPILKRYLELFEEHYNGSRKIGKGPLGVLLLFQAWNETHEGIPSELYQEILYHENGILDQGANKGVLSPAPTWGKRRACHFLVAAVANYFENAELHLSNDGSNDLHLQVPILSRIPGSRMCVDEQETSKAYNRTQIIDSMKWWERS